MPDRLHPDTVARIEDALRDAGPNPSGQFVKQLAQDFYTTPRTIYHYKKRVLANTPLLPRSGGARRLISWKMEQVIKLLLDKEPWWY
jgi:hypothetical protein